MVILPKANYRFNMLPIKLPMTFFHKTRMKDPKIYMEPEKTQNCQSNLRKKKNKARGIPSHTLILQSQYLKHGIAPEQTYARRNRRESPGINPHTHGQIISNRGGKYNGEKIVSLASGVGKAGQAYVNH